MKTSIDDFIATIPGWLTKHEGQFLKKAAIHVTSTDGEIVEIGSYCGKSTIHLAQSKKRVYAIDPHKGTLLQHVKMSPTYHAFIHNLTVAGVRNRVIPIVKTSNAAAKNWKKPIALLFIDGLHDEEHAREDEKLWSCHIADSGMIAMHDAFCGWLGPGRVAMERIVHNSEFSEIGVVGSIIYGRKGKKSFITQLDRFRSLLFIELSQRIYLSHFIPKTIAFLIVHRCLRLFLINRFTSFR